jgi:hypothetical protein
MQTDKHDVANKHTIGTFQKRIYRPYSESDKETDRMKVVINKREKITEDGTKYG